jgi:predicted RNase H-like HicB family nuclease
VELDRAFTAWGPLQQTCATQGETVDEFLANVREAIEGCLGSDLNSPPG